MNNKGYDEPPGYQEPPNYPTQPTIIVQPVIGQSFVPGKKPTVTTW
jgi:hypothetical protein